MPLMRFVVYQTPAMMNDLFPKNLAFYHMLRAMPDDFANTMQIYKPRSVVARGTGRKMNPAAIAITPHRNRDILSSKPAP